MAKRRDGDHGITLTAPLNDARVAAKKDGEETPGSAPHSPLKAKASAHVRRTADRRPANGLTPERRSSILGFRVLRSSIK